MHSKRRGGGKGEGDGGGRVRGRNTSYLSDITFLPSPSSTPLPLPSSAVIPGRGLSARSWNILGIYWPLSDEMVDNKSRNYVFSHYTVEFRASDSNICRLIDNTCYRYCILRDSEPNINLHSEFKYLLLLLFLMRFFLIVNNTRL